MSELVRRIRPMSMTAILYVLLMLGILIVWRWAAQAQDSSLESPAAGWQQGDIGGVANGEGDAQVDGLGTFTVSSTGTGIGGSADAFHFVYQVLPDKSQFVVRVLGVAGGDGWAQAGVMVRENFGSNAPYTAMLLTASNGMFFQWRSEEKGWGESASTGTNASPYWLKWVRWGQWMGGYCSANGVTWTLMGWQTLSTNNPVYVGLVASHGGTDGICRARFDQVSGGLAVKPAGLPWIGNGDGLWGSYFNNRHLSGSPATNRVDKWVNFSWGIGGPDCIGRTDEFGIRWVGEVQAQYSEPYTFHVESDDGVRLWLNERLVIDNWTSNRQANATVNLKAGQKYLLRLEYYENRVFAAVGLRWSSPSTLSQAVPQSQLYSQVTDTDGNGLADFWEMAHFGHLGVDPQGDPDGDGLSNKEEYARFSNPNDPLNWGVPNEWSHGDIGWGGIGAAGYSNGVFTVSSSGGDVYSQVDTFHFVYRPLEGNGEIVARIIDLESTNGWAKAGVMVRDSLDDNARNAMMVLTPANGENFQWRPRTDGWSRRIPSGNTNWVAPCWVKVVRWGEWLGGYSSTDGMNWTLVGWITMDMGQRVYVGLGASSRIPQDSCVAKFDRVSVEPANETEVLFPVVGDGDGLASSLYSNPYLSGTPVTNKMIAEIDFDWKLGAPMSAPSADLFSVCWRGEIQAQFTEPYTFHMERDEGVRIWLNEQLIIDQWVAGTGQQDATATVNLVAGQRYLLRVEYFENYGYALARLKWSSPSTPKQVVPQSQLYTRPTDADDNGLPDIWEMIHFGRLGIDPNDDPDRDGLSNLQEYLHHTDPLNPDTDGDGIPDGWEVLHGLNPTDPTDVTRDDDQDGLSNSQEYLHNTDPHSGDTDGDGVPDGLEVNNLHTDPTAQDLGLVTEVASISGFQGHNFRGRWQMDGQALYGLDRRGAVEYTLTTTNADKLLLSIRGTQNWAESLQSSFDLILMVDGESLGHHELVAPYGNDGLVQCLTPYLAAGEHTVRIFWDGAASLSSLKIRQVSLASIGGRDANKNGIKDWVEKILAEESGRDTNAAWSSYTSPLCMEGRDPYPSMMTIRSGTNLITVQPNAGLRWYADVPLSAERLVPVTIRYQNGGRVEQSWLEWRSISVFASTNLTIRSGNALLLSSGPQPRPVQISILKGTKIIAQYQMIGTQTQLFTNEGDYTIVAASGAQNGGLRVKVVKHQFPEGPVCVVGVTRTWDITNLPPAIECDPRLQTSQANLSAAVRRINIMADENGKRTIISRVNEGGAITASATAQGVRFFATPETYNRVLEQYPDGSRLVEALEILSPAPSNIVVHIDIIVGGITFEDGTTSKQLTAADFDELGQYRLRFIMGVNIPTANCHTIRIYQGSQCVWSY